MGFWKDHADTAAQLYRVHAAGIDILPLEQHLALYSATCQLVHTVQASHQGALAAPRRPDDGRNPLPRHRQADVPYCQVVPVEGAEGLYFNRVTLGPVQGRGYAVRVAAAGMAELQHVSEVPNLVDHHILLFASMCRNATATLLMDSNTTKRTIIPAAAFS